MLRSWLCVALAFSSSWPSKLIVAFATQNCTADDWGDKYWEWELERSQEHEWYGQNWETLVKHIPDISLAPPSRILHVGCGTSPWVSSMASQGINVTHIDISPALVSKLRQRFPSLDIQVADVTSLQFESDVFDVVVEKGTLDAVFLAGLALAEVAVKELFRVLHPGGSLVSVTGYAGPNQEGPFLGAVAWSSQTFLPLPTSSTADAYLCTK